MDDHRRRSSAATLIVSVRNLGYSRNAGEFVKRWFARHRQRRRPPRHGQGGRADGASSAQKFGDLAGAGITARIAELAEQFLHEPAPEKKEGAGRALDRRSQVGGRLART